ncbi:MAG: hypothetical protein NC923_06300 [Candidatus Omnitrophica bacterium]|nr:hypothetical protein [Candidatus Omnitrophota bacterium]
MRQGVIVDSIALVDSVSTLMNGLRKNIDLKIRYLYTNISGQDIVTKYSRAIIPLAERGNKVITRFDIERANEQARILGSSLDDEIIHIVPSGYAIDFKKNIINPLGLYSHKLEVDLFLICARLSSLQTLTRVINQAGYETKDVFFSGLVTSRAALGPDIKEGINFFCDIGSDNTELLLFKDGLLKDIEMLPVGGDDITRKLQDTLMVSFALAEDIKRSYGIVTNPTQIKEENEILVKKNNFYKPIKQKLIAEIINTSAKELCERIKNAVDKKVTRYEIKNFVVAGRTALLDGFIEAMEDALSLPVKLGRIDNPDIPYSIKGKADLSAHKYLTYLTALGMICEVLQGRRNYPLSGRQTNSNPILNAFARFKEIYEEYF